MAVSSTYKASWGDLTEAVKNYYGSGSDQWVKVATHTATPKELASILKQVPSVNTTVNKNGEILAWDLQMPIYNKATSTITNIGEYTDSNLVPSTQGSSSLTTIKVPSQTGNIIDGEFVDVPMTSSLVKYKTGQLAPSGSFLTILGSLSSALTAVSVGIQLGVTIDSLLYKANPDFWDEHGMSSLNPETWADITADDESINASIFNALLGIDNDSNDASMYIDERAFAYMAMYLQTKGVFTEYSTAQPSQSAISQITGISHYVIPMPFYNSLTAIYTTGGESYTVTSVVNTSSSDVYFISTNYDGSHKGAYALSLQPFTLKYTNYQGNERIIKGDSLRTTLGLTYYYANNIGSYDVWNVQPAVTQLGWSLDAIAYLLFNSTITHGGAIDGIVKQENATTPTLTNNLSIDECLSILKELYNDLWDNRIENTVLQDDGSTQTNTYIPIPMPTGGINTEITTEGAVQGDITISSSLDDESDTNEKIATILQILTGKTPSGITNKVTPTETPNTPDTGGGDTPIIIPPIGTASALWSIYNPTLAQVKALGSYLWSADFVDQLVKLVTNPMEAVISLHKVFGTPTTDGTGNIKVGYLDTGVSDVKLVSEQYISIDCGSVDLPEYFGNVFDYAPYTEISLYLPFIGIVRLNTADVLRSTISIAYKVDVLTGACLAQISVKRDAAGGVLYQYTGNCCVEYPLSSGSYLGILSSALGVATGAVAGAAVGGVGGALLGGATKALHASGASYERSGNFSGNAGAMGIKKPYLIISRPQTNMADNVGTLQGFPTNTYTALSACNGYTVVKACNVDTIANATDREKEMIANALKSGVIIK